MRWPRRLEVDAAARAWAESLRASGEEPRLLAAGYFGSYARGDWGVGSDLDLVVILEIPEGEATPSTLELSWARDIRLPVPHDLLVYSTRDLATLAEISPRFLAMLRSEPIWLVGALPVLPS